MSADRGDELLEAVEDLLQGTEFEVVDVRTEGSSRGLVVRVLVDKPGGVSIDDCSRVSRAVGNELEELPSLKGAYVLEVSSPGVDRPLRRGRDYERFAGEQVQIATFERVEGLHKHRGELLGYDREREAVLLKDEAGESVAIPRSSIRKAHLKRNPWEKPADREADSQTP